MARTLNLVFQGGGVRGVAYAGALAAMPQDYKLHIIAGASAGSIVAALLAIGKTAQQIKTILSDPELFQLLEPGDASRTERIAVAFREAAGIVDPKTGKISVWRAYQFRRKHKEVFGDMGEVLAVRGLHGTVRLRKWLDRITEGKRFRQATACEELKIFAADISLREYRTYSKAKTPEMFIAQALLASSSIPIFFEPHNDGSSLLVDGGTLSNFPSFLIGQDLYPTVGFRLDDFLPPDNVTDIFSYLKSILLTMAEAHDKFRDIPPNFGTYPIYTAKIPATKFNLTPDDVELLYQLGLGIGKSVDWVKYSADKPEVISYYDPKPQQALQFSLRQTHSLWQSFANQKNWLDGFKHDAIFTVRIERDWSVVYDRIGQITVTGKRPLFASAFRLAGVSPDLGGCMSLADAKYKAEEIHGDGSVTALVAIPAFNGMNLKGFLLFLTPPLEPGDPARTTHTQFRVDGEFVNTLAKGSEGIVAYSAVQLAHDHQIKLKFRLLVDQDLPELDFIGEFGREFKRSPDFADEETRRSYREYVSHVGWTPVGGKAEFKVRLMRK